MSDLNIELFIKKVNELDPYKKDWNARLLRHYTNEGFIDSPKKVGRKVFYNENHMRQVLKISEMKEQGINLSKIKHNSSDNINTLRKNALEALNSENSLGYNEIQEKISSANCSFNSDIKSQCLSDNNTGSGPIFNKGFQELILEDGLEIKFSKDKINKVMSLIQIYNKMEEENE